jgi:type I restriction enzyme, S subunit
MPEAIPLKHLVRINPETLGEDTPADLEFRYIEISTTGRGKLTSEPIRTTFAESPSRARRVLAPGDTIISTVRTYLRAVWTLTTDDSDLVGSTGFACLRPSSRIDARFLGWLAQSDVVVEEVVARSVGVSYPAINADAIGTIKVALPSMPRQRAIADYLDRETAQIDALIEKKQRLVALLAERESRAFQDAVEHRGVAFPLDLEADWWDGQLPDGWRLMHLSRALVQLTNGYVGPTRDILVLEGIPYIQSVHIKGGRIDFGRRPFFVERAWHDERPRIHLRAGDVLIVQTGDIGQVAVVPDEFGEASCHALQIARVRRDVLSGEYLGAYLRSPFGYNSLLCRATGALHPHLEASIRDVPILVPPKSTQEQILSEVNREQRRNQVVSGKLVHEIALLQERREAVIAAGVTGKLELQKLA